jgi:hypothetical protein
MGECHGREHMAHAAIVLALYNKCNCRQCLYKVDAALDGARIG